MTGAKTLSITGGIVICEPCGGVSGNPWENASAGESCNLDVTTCNGAGNLPLLALIPGDFKFNSGHLRGYCKNLRKCKRIIFIHILYYCVK